MLSHHPLGLMLDKMNPQTLHNQVAFLETLNRSCGLTLLQCPPQITEVMHWHHSHGKVTSPSELEAAVMGLT